MAIHLKPGKIPEIRYKDFYINQKNIPKPGDEEYEEFHEKHDFILQKGCYVDGVYFSGLLYWHLNLWKTELDILDDFGNIVQEYAAPLLRDNEWIISQAIRQAENERKGLPIGGARRISKSTWIASYLAYGVIMDRGSENVLVGTTSEDIQVTLNKVEKGLNELPEYWKLDKIETNKKQWTFGARLKDGTKKPFSYLMIRNLDEGRAEETIAGTKPRKLVIEEAAKASYLKALQAAIPGFTTPHGWGCAPIVIYTGGNAEKFADAKELHMNPEAYNFLSFPNEETPDRRHGLTLGNKYRQEAKFETTLGSYLRIEDLKSDLYKIPMLVSDEEKAKNILHRDLEMAKKSTDPSAYNKQKMYFPETVDDIFLNLNSSIFNTNILVPQKTKLLELGIKGTPVELFYDGSMIKHRHSSKKFITEFPLKTQSADAPIMIWEFPVPNPPKFLYVAGVDSYRFDKSSESASLGSVYIFKRMHSLTGEGMVNSIVASYTARPDRQEDWEEQARLLIMYYNAYALVENDELGFINYMKNKKSATGYLAPTPKFQKAILPHSAVNRDFGLSRSSLKIRDFLNDSVKRYMEETIHSEYNEEGAIISEVLGVTRVPDPMLLEEMIQYRPDLNTDRLVAFSLALAQANDLDPLLGTFGGNKGETNFSDSLSKTLSKKIKSGSMFKGGGSLFKTRHKLF